jgi:16S rRNA (adenine1518-N6/adenine1519-N6)-dimethyltransferase
MSTHLRFFKQRKALSQIFLRENWPCRKLAEHLRALNIDEVVEIGPGAGILTQVLLSERFKVDAVEKDSHLIEHLEDLGRQHEGDGQLSVHHQDILKFAWPAWLDGDHRKKGVCGNIPYHISTPIVTQILGILPHIQGAALMVQLEFAERLAAAPGNKNYGSLSVYGQLRSNIRLAFKVPRSCFHPVPKVDSAVITITPRTQLYSAQTLERVEQLTRRAFSQRRKMLSNSLAPFIEKAAPHKVKDFDWTRRCDSLSPSEYVELSDLLFA